MTKLMLLAGGWTILGHDVGLQLPHATTSPAQWIALWLWGALGVGMTIGAAARLGGDADD